MKILMVIDSLIAGGKERRLVQLLTGLGQHEDITCELVVLSDRIHYQEVYDLGINVHIIKRKPAQDPRTVPKLLRITKKFKPDIIQAWDSMGAIFCVPVAKISGAKFVNAMIVAAPRKIKSFSNLWVRSKLTFPFSDLILSNSKAGLESFGISHLKKAKYVHNGIDMNRFSNLKDPDLVRKELNITRPIVIGMVAAFSGRKDWPSFIRLAHNVLELRNDVCFVCVGDGELLNEIKASVKDEYRPHIFFTGARNDVEDIMNIFDIGILSTITEGIPNSILEYMSLGKPVIATGAGGTSELVVEGETGFMVKRKRADQLVVKTKLLLKNPDKAKTMGEAGYQRIIKHFTMEAMTNRFIEVYGELLK